MRLECSSKSTKAQIRLAKMSWQAVPKSRTSCGELTIAVTRTCSGDEARVDSRRSQLAAVCGGDELTVLCQIGWCCAVPCRALNTMTASLKCMSAYYTLVINFSKNYRNVIIVPAAVAMLLERQRPGTEQLSVSSTTIKLRCHARWILMSVVEYSQSLNIHACCCRNRCG